MQGCGFPPLVEDNKRSRPEGGRQASRAVPSLRTPTSRSPDVITPDVDNVSRAAPLTRKGRIPTILFGQDDGPPRCEKKQLPRSSGQSLAEGKRDYSKGLERGP